MHSTSLEKVLSSSATLCTAQSRDRLAKCTTLDSLIAPSPRQDTGVRSSASIHQMPCVPEQAKQPLLAQLEPQIRICLSTRQPSAGEEISNQIVHTNNPEPRLAVVLDWNTCLQVREQQHQKLGSPITVTKANSTIEVEASNKDQVASEKRNQTQTEVSGEFVEEQKFNLKVKPPQNAALFSSSNSSDNLRLMNTEFDTHPETKSQCAESHASGSKKKVRWLQIQDICEYSLEQKYSGSMKELSVSQEAPATSAAHGSADVNNWSPIAKISPLSDQTGYVFSLGAQDDPNKPRVCPLDNEDNRSRLSGTASQKTPRAGILKNKTRAVYVAKEDQTSNFSILSGSASRDNGSHLASETSDKLARQKQENSKPRVIPSVSEQGSSEGSCVDSSVARSHKSARDIALIGTLVFFSVGILLWELLASQ